MGIISRQYNIIDNKLVLIFQPLALKFIIRFQQFWINFVRMM